MLCVCVCVCVLLSISVSIRTANWRRLLSQCAFVTDSFCCICFLNTLKIKSTIMTRLCSPTFAVALNWLQLPWQPQLLALSVLASTEENSGPRMPFPPRSIPWVFVRYSPCLFCLDKLYLMLYMSTWEDIRHMSKYSSSKIPFSFSQWLTKAFCPGFINNLRLSLLRESFKILIWFETLLLFSSPFLSSPLLSSPLLSSSRPGLIFSYPSQLRIICQWLRDIEQTTHPSGASDSASAHKVQ